jgi:hypothetical protein
MSPIRAVIIIKELRSPKWIVGTKELSIRTPKPIQRIRDDEMIALPLESMVDPAA